MAASDEFPRSRTVSASATTGSRPVINIPSLLSVTHVIESISARIFGPGTQPGQNNFLEVFINGVDVLNPELGVAANVVASDEFSTDGPIITGIGDSATIDFAFNAVNTVVLTLVVRWHDI